MSHPVAVGIDAVEVDRIRRAVARTPRFAERTFTAAELAYCNEARDPAERLAARWAAKEAVIKCLGGGVPGIDLRTVEVVRDADGAPGVVVTAAAAARAAERGIDTWLVSLTHTTSIAEAVVIAMSSARS